MTFPTLREVKEVQVLKRSLIIAVCSAVGFGACPTPTLAAKVADNGFRPNPDGFSFANYAHQKGYENLSSVEMQQLFGPAVCVNSAGAAARAALAPGGASPCTLIPPAKEWMDTANAQMSIGHCQGFAVLAQRLYKHQFAGFGPGTTFSYRIKGNTALQRAIAEAWVSQSLESVVSARVRGTPNQILAKVEAALTPGNPETYALGIYSPDGSGGHAITPYAVERMGAHRFALEVYDNNYPGQTRKVIFNTAANTWSYNAAVNPHVEPEPYSGTARNPRIELDPTTPGLGVQPCPFCQPGANHTGAPRQRDTIRLLGSPRNHAHLVISGKPGQRVGVIGGRIINTFPGAQVVPILGPGEARSGTGEGGERRWADLWRGSLRDFDTTQEPTYMLWSQNVGSMGYYAGASINIDGRTLVRPDTETLSDVGPGRDIALENVKVSPGQRDSLRLLKAAKQITFTSARGAGSGSPVLALGADTPQADYSLKLKLVNFQPGATLHAKLNLQSRRITFYSTGNPGRATYLLSAVKLTGTRTTVEDSATEHLRGAQAATYKFLK